MNMETLIYTINMNKEDLTKMTKEELMSMLLGQKSKTVSVKQTVPVKKAASTTVGAVF